MLGVGCWVSITKIGQYDQPDRVSSLFYAWDTCVWCISSRDTGGWARRGQRWCRPKRRRNGVVGWMSAVGSSCVWVVVPLTPTVGSKLGLGWRWGDADRRLTAADNSPVTGELADARLVGCEVAIEGSSALGLYLHKEQLLPLLPG